MTQEEKQFELRIHIEIEDRRYHQGRLSISESLYLNVADFLTMAKILGQFHELAEQIKKSQSDQP